jgi:hypothetical protein
MKALSREVVHQLKVNLCGAALFFQSNIKICFFAAWNFDRR